MIAILILILINSECVIPTRNSTVASSQQAIALALTGTNSKLNKRQKEQLIKNANINNRK